MTSPMPMVTLTKTLDVNHLLKAIKTPYILANGVIPAPDERPISDVSEMCPRD